MNPYLQDILHNITTRLAKLEEAQLKKEWVGMTDDELSDAYNLHYEKYFKDIDYVDFLLIYKAVEAKLKEKNNA